MFEIVLRKLTIWRNEKARMEGVDLFRVLPNKSLEEIAIRLPKDKAELTAINGIKEAKFGKYGREILAIVKECAGEGDGERNDEEPVFHSRIAQKRQEEKVFSVGEYLDALNARLIDMRARVKGEVTSVDERERAVYFSIKDKGDESVINCFIFRYQYDTLGVRLVEGMEVVLEGYPEIYKPYGRLSLRTSSIELEGEGALKKEYEALKKKLEEEGFFDEDRKKRLARLPQRIGLITSREGAAIGDFMSNIGQFGLTISFVNSSVEGRRAVFELINGIRVLCKEKIDILVIIRGGGSLESLQAFNNEALIREAKKANIPIVCGVGHDRDISLLSLSSDYAVSTPTAAARLIGGLWEREVDRLDGFEKNILDSFSGQLDDSIRRIRDVSSDIDTGFRDILEDIQARYDGFLHTARTRIGECIAEKEKLLDAYQKEIDFGFASHITQVSLRLERVEDMIKLNDPTRQLRLGYGIISKDDSGISSVGQLTVGDNIKIRMSDGEMRSQIKSIKKFKE